MAILTDLTWQQLAANLPQGSVSVVEGNILIAADMVIGRTSEVELNEGGVIKFFSVLFSAANKAQIEANLNQVEGEKLAAFAPATIGTSSNGFITLTRPFVCRAELATAINIIGTNT